MDKLNYEVPEMEVILFESEDIITSSGIQNEWYDPDELPFQSVQK